MPNDKDILAKFTAHEKAIGSIVDKHRAAASKLQAELNAAENTLSNFETLPTAENVTAALAAQGTANHARQIITRLGPLERRELSLRDSYTAQNSAELFRLLESLHDVRSAPRDAFRKSIAGKLAPLHAVLSLDPEDGPTLKQVERLERELNTPEFVLSHADDALRDFRALPTHSNFVNAKNAAQRIEFPNA